MAPTSNTMWRIEKYPWAVGLHYMILLLLCLPFACRWFCFGKLQDPVHKSSCHEQNWSLDTRERMFEVLDSHLMAQVDQHILKDQRTQGIFYRWLHCPDRTDNRRCHVAQANGSNHLHDELWNNFQLTLFSYFLSLKLTIIASKAERNEKYKKKHQADDICTWTFSQRASELWIMMELFSC